MKLKSNRTTAFVAALMALFPLIGFAGETTPKEEMISILSSKALQDFERLHPELSFTAISEAGGLGGCAYGYDSNIYTLDFYSAAVHGEICTIGVSVVTGLRTPCTPVPAAKVGDVIFDSDEDLTCKKTVHLPHK